MKYTNAEEVYHFYDIGTKSSRQNLFRTIIKPHNNGVQYFVTASLKSHKSF